MKRICLLRRGKMLNVGCFVFIILHLTLSLFSNWWQPANFTFINGFFLYFCYGIEMEVLCENFFFNFRKLVLQIDRIYFGQGHAVFISNFKTGYFIFHYLTITRTQIFSASDLDIVRMPRLSPPPSDVDYCFATKHKPQSLINLYNEDWWHFHPLFSHNLIFDELTGVL